MDPNRTVYRFKLAQGSFRHNIPPTATSVIVKQQKDEWEEEFEDEERAYNRLKDLQGKVIPTFYGRGQIDGIPALILSELHGIKLNDLARSNDCEVPVELLKAYLEKVFDEFSKHNALYRDQKLDNFLLCDEGKVMVVDLEQVEFPAQLRDWQYSINQEGARSLVEDFTYLRRPKRESSPLAFWMPACDENALQDELLEFGPAGFRERIGKPTSTAA